MNYIANALNEIEEFQDGITNLWERKPIDKIIIKAAEEMIELAEKLIKRVNEEGKVQDEEIVEEMIDVNMHLQLLEKLFLRGGNDYAKRINALEVSKIKVVKMLSGKSYKKYATGFDTDRFENF
jgi:hypothetical protein